MKMRDVTVDICGPSGVKRTVKGVLAQSGLCRRRGVRGFISGLSSTLFSASTRSALLGYIGGVLFSLLFGSMLLFLQKITVWPCAYITVAVGCVSAFGMGLSQNIRADVAVMMPSICSGHSRNLVSLILVSVLVTGPISNSLHNTELAASSLVCSAQLAANQTQDLLKRAASPLASVLERLREISSNAYETAGRIQNLVEALTDSVRHIARTLRNLLHFLVDIGDICNEELGTPYRKCQQLFRDAKADCDELLGDFGFLCEIVGAFLPLCELAKAGQLFCVIPSYVAEQLKKHLATPVVAAFDRLKQEFVFDLDATVTFDLEANSSQSLQEVTQQILEEVTSDLRLLEMLRQPLNYTAVLLLLWTYYKAARYRRRYLKDLDYDNIYITAGFRDLDRQVVSGGGVSVFPITTKESRIYTRPLSLKLSNREKRAMLVGLSSALRHLVICGVLLALDYLIFWILDQVRFQASEDIVVRAPVQLQMSVNGSGFAADIYRDLVQSFQILQQHNMTVFSRACVVQPREPDIGTSITLGFLLGLSMSLSICKGFFQRLRRVMCAWFHLQREQERIVHLRSKILEHRQREKRAFRIAFFRANPLRQGRIQALLVKIPGGSKLLKSLGLRNTCCIACSKDLDPESAICCDNPNCRAVYCGECHLSWNNSCVGCGQSLASPNDNLSDLELGSSDEEDSGPDLTEDQIQLRQI